MKDFPCISNVKRHQRKASKNKPTWKHNAFAEPTKLTESLSVPFFQSRIFLERENKLVS